MLPFVLALFLAYLLMPLVTAMTRPDRPGRRVPRPLAAFLALAALLGVVVLAIITLSPILTAEADRLSRVALGTHGQEPLLARRIASSFQSWRDRLYGTGVLPQELQDQLDQDAQDFVAGLGQAAAHALTSSLSVFPRLLELVAVPLLSFYILSDGPRLAQSTRALLPRTQQAAAAALMGRLDGVLREYIRGQLLSSLFIGVVVTAGLWLMGLKVALLVGAVALIVETIPFFGPLLWGTVAVLLALAQAPPGSPLPLLVGVFAIVAQQLDSHLVVPLILGRFTRVHPLLLIFGTLLGASLFGLLGMFLAAPITALVKETFLFVHQRVQLRDAPADLKAA